MLRGAVTLESCDGACIRTGSEIDEGGEGGVMDMDEQELELEDEIFEELSAEEEEETSLDAVLLGEDEEGFVQGSVDVEDLATGSAPRCRRGRPTWMRTPRVTKFHKPPATRC